MSEPDQKYNCVWCTDHGCENCPQPQYTLQPYGSKNPKIIIVLPYPDLDEVNHNKFLTGDKRKLIRVALQKQFYETYVTAIVKKVELIDPIAKIGVKKPSLTSFNFAFASLKKELELYPDAVIVPIGASAAKMFGIEGKFKDAVGKEHTWNNRRVIPNYETFFVAQKPRLISEFRLIFNKAFHPAIEEKKPEFRTLNYEEACYEIKRAYRLFREGVIDYIIFDTETTGFDAWGDELIMYSWAHEADEVGYAFPLTVNNEIKFSKEKFIKFSECEDELNQNLNTEYILNELPIDSENIPECMHTVNREVLKTWLPEAKKLRTVQRKKVKQIKEIETEKIYKREKEKVTTHFEVTKLQAGKFNNLLGHILKEVPIVGHNLKFDAKFLHEHDIISFDDIKILDDTWIMAFMIFNKGFGISNALEALVKKYFGISWKNAVHDFLDMFTRNVDKHYGNLPTKILGKYAGQDAYYNLKIYHKLKQDLPEGCDYITGILTKAIKVFGEAELNGIKVDWDVFNFLKDNYEATCKEHMEEMDGISIVQEFKEKHGSFNPGSPDQLRDILFGKKYFDLPSVKVKRFMTDKKLKPSHPKNKQSTDKNIVPFFMNWLDECDSGVFQDRCTSLLRTEDKKLTREDQYLFNHVIKKDPDVLDTKYTECRKFLDHYKAWKRIGGKLLPTYINPVPDRSPNDLYRPEFNINGTNTGRVSSGFHTMDQGSEITRMFISRWKSQGGLILAPDYSQIEVRIVAALAGETALIEAYTKGYDIHRQTAAKAYGIGLDEVTHDQRQHGKVLNFFTIYGGGPQTLANELGISLEAATKMLDNFFIAYPKLKSWSLSQQEILKRDGFITTVWGRQIPVPDIHSDSKMFVEHALRAATNYPVQSAASDCVTYSLIRIHEEFKKANLRSIIFASVHDSIEVDVYPSEIFKVVKIFKAVCEEEVQRMHPWITCPLKISFELGVSWGGALEFEIDEMTDNKLALTGSGLKKDFLLTKSVAERSYNAEISVIQSKGLSDKDFGSEYYFRDTEKWTAKFLLEGNDA